MVNEDILTSLRNAVDHGDSLSNAIRLAINTGYSQKEVEEAAQYISGGTITSFQPKPTEVLSMPASKKLLSSEAAINTPKPSFQTPIQNTGSSPPSKFQPIQSNPQNNLTQDISSIKENVSTGYVPDTYVSSYSPSSSNSSSISDELNKMKPRESHLKEILLLLVLLLLVGILVSTFIFKDAILKLFSGI